MPRCRDCQAEIVFMPTARGKLMPANPDGSPHPASCAMSPRNQRPVIPENVCAACGSDHVEREPGRGPHYGALRCLDCNAFRWLRKPQEATA